MFFVPNRNGLTRERQAIVAFAIAADLVDERRLVTAALQAPILGEDRLQTA
mgnify:CR=1 FL=1